MLAIRYALPAVLFLVGLGLFLLEPNSIGLEGLAMGTGAALSLLLLNVLFRAGVKGDRERVQEEAAREHFSRTGRWPDEDR